jgi:glycosyltransferase involved in cell wall biosynthesis
MLQATDADRFRPLAPVPEHMHDVVIVAKSRDVFSGPPPPTQSPQGSGRPSTAACWEPFVDPGLIVREYVPNDDLPKVYSSAGVLLNDHWETIARLGIRIEPVVDALACGTPVISRRSRRARRTVRGSRARNTAMPANCATS